MSRCFFQQFVNERLIGLSALGGHFSQLTQELGRKPDSNCFAIPLDGLPTRRTRHNSSGVDSGISGKSIYESGIGLAFPSARRSRADDLECFFFMSMTSQVNNQPYIRLASMSPPPPRSSLFCRLPGDHGGAKEHERGTEKRCAGEGYGRAET